MRRRLVHAFLVIVFSLSVGHLVCSTWLGPPFSPKYPLVASRALTTPEGATAQLYLRRQLFLPRRPRHAWIQVVGRDSIQLFVNGQRVGQKEADAMEVGLVADLTQSLQAGVNTLAIVAQEKITRTPQPIIAVEGGCLLDEQQGERPLWDDQSWRCSKTFERGAGGWWFSNEFHDSNWPLARTITTDLRATIDFPPRTRSAPPGGNWLSSAPAQSRQAAFRRDFEIAGRPQQAWMRVTSRSSFRLAVNGNLVDAHEDRLGTTQPGGAIRCNYDITPLMHPGRNAVTLLVQNPAGPAQIKADVEVEDASGAFHRFDTDNQWFACRGTPKEWLDSSPMDSSAWLPSQVETGDAHTPPWLAAGKDLELVLPLPVLLRRAAGQTAAVIITGLLTALACWWTGGLFALSGRSMPERAARRSLAYTALLLPTVLLTVAVVLSFDPRILTTDVYRPLWPCLAALSVPLQWVLIGGFLVRRGETVDQQPDETGTLTHSATKYGLAVTMVCLIAAGFWLRFYPIGLQPLQADEVTLYNYSQGWLKCGFPSMEITKDLPRYYICGCELESLGTAVASLVFDKDLYIIRVPTVCYSTLTILVMFFVGRRLFNSNVGLIAAAIYALSPYCCDIAGFGRYESQFQLFALLTVYSFWRAVGETGPISRPYVCLAGLSFVAMFLSWEASALLAPGLVLFALLHRRTNLGSILGDPVVWVSLAAVAAVVVLQQSHNSLQLVQFLVEGTGWGDVRPTPMWKYAFFKPWRYLFDASWSPDGLFSDVGILAAAFFAIRHPWRHPLRLLLICLVSTCLLLALVIPMLGSRYSYFLVPLVILLSSAALVAGIDRLAPWSALARLPAALHAYTGGVRVLVTVVVVSLACGRFVDLREMHPQVVSEISRSGLKHPNLDAAAEYISRHYQPGDVIIAAQPEIVDHCAATHSSGLASPLVCDYGLETVLQLYMLMPDNSPTPVHRFAGTPMIPNVESLNAILDRHNRVWYVSISGFDELYNTGSTLAYLEQNMDVAYQDLLCTVLLRDKHRPASVRRIEQDELRKSMVDLFH
ncbi:MAG TPA: glycosyltransferase family 39 protein [Planctomycetaceae bacterium]|nr:glycosyltransferase family 39 protein [Planctomycetaceae bacterium]